MAAIYVLGNRRFFALFLALSGHTTVTHSLHVLLQTTCSALLGVKELQDDPQSSQKPGFRTWKHESRKPNTRKD